MIAPIRVVSISHARSLLNMHRIEASILEHELMRSGNGSYAKRIRRQEQLKTLRTKLIPRDESRLISMGESVFL